MQNDSTALEQINEPIEYAESLGFKNLRFVSDLSKFVFEYYDLSSKTHFLLVFENGYWQLSDGRPTVNVVFHKGEFPLNSKIVSVMLQNAGNLRRTPEPSQSL